MVNDSCINLSAKLAKNSEPGKSCCGVSSYTYAALKEKMMSGFKQEAFEIEIDGVKVNPGYNVETTMLRVNNGKFS